MLDALRDRRRVAKRTALVVAHPDDETLAAGGSLHLFPGLLLVHVTDGAPRTGEDARRAGFATPGAYAAARAGELAAALALSGAAPARAHLGVPDQQAAHELPGIVARLAALFREHAVEAVLTHAYEGGHPDHDACAVAVRRAAPAGTAVFEFPLYHAAGRQAFLPGGPEEMAMALPPADAARKRAMLDCFRTQAAIVAEFDVGVERFRPAAEVDFARPPHVGPLNYEAWGWALDGAAWRALAARCGV